MVQRSEFALGSILTTVLFVLGMAFGPPAYAEELIIAAHTGPTLTAKELEEKIELFAGPALRKAEVCDWTTAKVDEIEESFYRTLLSVLSGIRTAEPPADTEVKRSMGQSDYFDITLSPFVDLVRMDVEYYEAGQPKKESFKPADANDETQPLRYHSAGYYVFKIRSGCKLLKYRLVTKKRGRDDPSEEEIERIQYTNYDESERHFLIRLVGFSGSKEAFLKVLEKAEVVGDPIVGQTEGVPTTILLADFLDSIDSVEDSVNGNIFITRISDLKLRAGVANRVWMLFPISDDELAGVKEKLLAGDPTPVKLSERINAGKDFQIVGARDAKSPSETEGMNLGGTKLLPTDTARWYELLPTTTSQGGHYFERKFFVDDKPGWRSSKYVDRVRRIIAYEFVNADTGNATLLRVLAPSGEKVLFYDEEVRQWPFALK